MNVYDNNFCYDWPCESCDSCDCDCEHYYCDILEQYNLKGKWTYHNDCDDCSFDGCPYRTNYGGVCVFDNK